MKKTIIILCTWSKNIGIGHIKRAESLSRSILELEKELNLLIFLNNIKELPNFIKFPDQIKLLDIRQLSDYLYSCLTSELRKDTLKAEAI